MLLVFLKDFSSFCDKKRLEECRNKSKEITLESIAIFQARDYDGLDYAGKMGW